MKAMLAVLIAFPEIAWAQDATPALSPPVPQATTQVSAAFGSSCEYPASALNPYGQGTSYRQGRTDLTYFVTAEGKVVDVTMRSRSWFGHLDSAAVQCVGG